MTRGEQRMTPSNAARQREADRVAVQLLSWIGVGAPAAVPAVLTDRFTLAPGSLVGFGAGWIASMVAGYVFDYRRGRREAKTGDR